VIDDPTQPIASDGTTERASIGRYKIDRVLGRGGMGIVVAAHDPELDRKVAVKILVDQQRSSDSLGTALRREAQAQAKVSHVNVLSVFDAGVDGAPYLVMQLVEGETPGAYRAPVKPEPRDVISMFLQAARGLAAIHAAGLIHRDFKPSNALVDRAGVVRVSDLGLARITELAAPADASSSTTGIAGTPAYMAPEQFERMDITPAADQFSFCVSLWEALFGERPFKSNAAAVANLPEPPRTDGLAKHQLQALRRGLARDPADRWPSMNDLITALTPRSRARWLAAGGGVAVLGVAAVALALPRSHDAPPPAKPTAPSTPAWRLSDARRLTLTEACDEYPTVAPDGTIYYDQNVGADQPLMALAPGAREPRELTQTEGWGLAPSVSPDGRRIAFLRKTDSTMAAHVADLADLGSAKKLVPGGFRPAWSPDSKYVWAGARKGITRFDATTLKADRTLIPPDGSFPMAAVELVDGRVVMLVKKGTAVADGVAIFDAGATTSRWLLPASDDTPMDEVLTLAPSGDAVLVAKYTVTFSLEIWQVPLDGRPAFVVSGSAVNAHKKLAILGKRLVWSDCTEYGTIAALERAPNGSSRFVDASRNKWQDFAPAAIPGTKDIAFLTYRTQKDELWRMTATGDAPRHVPFGDVELDRITVSHDGKLLTGANDDGLWVGPLDGSAPPTKLVPGGDGSEHNATFSRDDKTLIFESREGTVDRIASIPVRGGTPRWVLPAPSVAPAQSPTADLLAYLKLAGGEDPLARVVMLLDQKTGKTRPLSASLAPYPYRDLHFSQDGTKLLAARRDGAITELDVATGNVLRTFDVGADQLFGETYSDDGTVLVGRSTSAGDLWEADLEQE